MREKDYYQVLGVSENAAPDELKQAYRRLAKRYHPDARPGDKAAEERFKEISRAYDTLGSPDKRKQYDKMRNAFSGGFRPEGFDFGGIDFEDLRRGSGRAGRGGRGPVSFEEILGGGGLGDFFSVFMDQGDFIRQARSGPRQGDDISATVNVTHQQALRGGTVRLKVKKNDVCADCSGSGAAPGARPRTCRQCAGAGMISIAKGGFGIQRPCSRCYGRGTIIEQFCDRCRGTGRMETIKTVSFKVPAEIRSGSLIRVRGQGNPGTGGGPPGDLMVQVVVSPALESERRGKDQRARLRIDLATAARGGRVRLRIPGGSAILTIPPRTKPGTVFRLKGRAGAPRAGSLRGDLLVKADVRIPKHPTPEEKKLLELISVRDSDKV